MHFLVTCASALSAAAEESGNAVLESGTRLGGDSVDGRSVPRAVRSHRDGERAKHASGSPERAKRARRELVDCCAGPREQLPWRLRTPTPDGPCDLTLGRAPALAGQFYRGWRGWYSEPLAKLTLLLT